MKNKVNEINIITEEHSTNAQIDPTPQNTGTKVNQTKIIIATEECATNNQIKFIINEYFKSIGITVAFDNIQLLQTSENLYKISGIKSGSHEGFYLLIANGSGSFVDMLLYDEPSIDNLNTKSPKIAMEVTKNSPKEAGNMTSQRLSKWATIKNDPLFKQTRKIYLIDHKKKIVAKDVGLANDRTFAIMNLLGAEVYFKEIRSAIASKYTPRKTFNTLPCLSYRGTANKVSITPSLVTIETNFYKNKTNKTGHHDPNVGWVCGMVAAIRTFDKSISIVVEANCPPKHILGQNKLSRVLFEAQVKIKYNNVTESAPKPTSKKVYWVPETTGEKIGSISLEFDLRNKGKKVIFSNHAGCEKSYVCTNKGALIPPKKGKGIPDLVYHDSGKRIIVVEAEQHTNYKSGLSQVNKTAFREWITKMLGSYSGYIVEIYISTNKKNDTRQYVIYDGFGKYNKTEPVYTMNL